PRRREVVQAAAINRVQPHLDDACFCRTAGRLRRCEHNRKAPDQKTGSERRAYAKHLYLRQTSAFSSRVSWKGRAGHPAPRRRNASTNPIIRAVANADGTSWLYGCHAPKTVPPKAEK